MANSLFGTAMMNIDVSNGASRRFAAIEGPDVGGRSSLRRVFDLLQSLPKSKSQRNDESFIEEG